MPGLSGTQIRPSPAMGGGSPAEPARPRAPLTLLISRAASAPAGLLFLLVCLVSGGDLDIEFPAGWDAISHLALAVGTLEERRRRCDMKVKAAVSLGKGFFYYIHHLHFAAVSSEGKPPRTCLELRGIIHTL